MDDLRLAPLLGIVASLAFLGTLGLPYVLTESAGGASAYYAAGAIDPLVAGLFGLVTIIVFAAGREGRTDPDLAAGVGLALGAFMAIVALAWALTVPTAVAWEATGGIDTLASYHRWLVAGVAAVVPLSGAWFARALGVL